MRIICGADDLILDKSGLKVFYVKLFSPIFFFGFSFWCFGFGNFGMFVIFVFFSLFFSSYFFWFQLIPSIHLQQSNIFPLFCLSTTLFFHNKYFLALVLTFCFSCWYKCLFLFIKVSIIVYGQKRNTATPPLRMNRPINFFVHPPPSSCFLTLILPLLRIFLVMWERDWRREMVGVRDGFAWKGKVFLCLSQLHLTPPLQHAIGRCRCHSAIAPPRGGGEASLKEQ